MSIRLALLPILCCGLLHAGDVAMPPTAIWPLPVPAWLRERVLAEGLLLTQVTASMPAGLARLKAGEACVAIGGMAPCSQREFVLAVRLAAMRADNSGELLRDGQPRAVRMPAFMAWARWGIQTADPACPAPAELDAVHAAAWPALPLRVRLVAARLAVGGADRAWLPVLIALATSRPAAPPVAVVRMPDPYLERVAAWWRLCSAGNPPPIDDVDEALFRAAHLPWPYEPEPAAGTLATGDAEADKLLGAWAEGRQPTPNELVRLASRLASTGLPQLPGPAGSYLGQCLAAVADPDSHGGWPYRSALIWDTKGRAGIVSTLADWAGRDPANAAIAALGRVGPAVMDGDRDALQTALTTLQHASPWMARNATRIALHAGRMHNKTPWLIETMRALPANAVSPGLPARLDLLAARPGIDPDDLLSAQGPNTLERLAETWTQHVAWNRQLAAGPDIAKKLNDALWGAATDPAGLDAEACLPLARQLVLAHGLAGAPHWQVDTVAAAFMRAGHPTDAVFWQQTAITKLGDARMSEEERTTALADYRQRLGQMYAGQQVNVGEGEAVAAKPVAEAAGLSTGMEVAGRRSGAWTTIGNRGTAVQIVAYRAGEPSGRYVARTPEGAWRWSGCIAKLARVGWWTIATADGGSANGWYNGEDKDNGARCGWWTILAADGSVRAEGLYNDGRPTAPWRARAADGTMQLADATTLGLPEDPPLPGAMPAPNSDF